MLRLALLAVLLVVAVACSASGGSGSVTMEGSPGASPGPDGSSLSGACAADSTRAFLDIQEEAPFTVYCPSLVPEGFLLTSLDFDVPPVATPEPDLGFFTAFFTNEETGDAIEFVQGNVGSAWEAAILRQREDQSAEEVSYGDFTVEFYSGVLEEDADFIPPTVFGHSADGRQHYIAVTGPDGDTLKAIAEGMAPVAP